MPTYHRPLLALLAFLLLIGGAARPITLAAAPPAAPAYIEPGLLAAGPGPRSVIVSAADAGAAARAVERHGGQVSSSLPLIDAVAALVPASRLTALAAAPGVTSVVANKGVRSADAGGWMSQARVLQHSLALPEPQPNPVVYLSDGAFVSVGETGQVLIVNADGSERARLSLPDGPFTLQPVAGADDTIYIASETKRLYALGPDGALRWRFADPDGARFVGGIAAGGSAVYAVDSYGQVYAIDALSGARRWSLGAARIGTTVVAPVAAADGTLYVVAQKGHAYAFGPAGERLWSENLHTPVTLAPLLSADGRSLYVASSEGMRLLALDAATGATRFRFSTPSRILAAPALGPDGSLYIPTENRALYGVGPDGRQRFSFQPAAGRFTTSPVLSGDGKTVYAAVDQMQLFAIDAQSGAERWRYTTAGTIKASPALDSDGGVVIGSEGRDLVRLSADGKVTFKTTVADKITQSARSNHDGSSTVRVGSGQLLTIGRLPEQWDGRPDVRATASPTVWELVNPVAVDIGADEIHATAAASSSSKLGAQAPASSQPSQQITGAGVTIAVVDSGVYFDNEIKRTLGHVVWNQFLGQVDFVASGCPGGYCAQTWRDSIDSYGHGTAVASVIWNNFTDHGTGSTLGVAPGASLLSVRVLDGDGAGSYETVIRGIQYVVENRAKHNIRVLNLSLSAAATTPYFVDPLNRAVEAAWAQGITVIAAAGNGGPGAESITVPGNDPYVITVGAVSSNRTPGYWADDYLPPWSATGPTGDGFVKPDILAPGANVVTFMHNAGPGDPATQKIVSLHPDSSLNASLFRMNGTSISAAVASGLAALMLQAAGDLSPDQVKYRMLASARPALAADSDLIYSPLQQGLGRIWAPDAIFGSFEPGARANEGMDLAADLAHGYATEADLAYHYQGPIRRALSDDGQTNLYYYEAEDGSVIGLGAAEADSLAWVDREALATGRMTWSVGRMTWSVGLGWEGGLSLASGRMTWSVGRMTWSVGRMTWSVGRMTWSVGRMTWSVTNSWGEDGDSFEAASSRWAAGSSLGDGIVSSTTWVDDD
jgi:serine protease AprX